MLVYDLHSHTTRSDGYLSPEALLAVAADRGVSALAITDHDMPCFPSMVNHPAVQVIAGTELSCVWSRQTIHVVGLNMTVSEPISDHCAEIQQARVRRAEEIARRLEKLGMTRALAGALEESGNEQIGRPHFARWMVKQGHVKDMRAAFKRYLGAGKIGDIKSEWPALAKAIEVIVQSGGIPVLAHPKQYQMTNTKLKALITDFVAAGGKALEVCNGFQPRDQVEYLARLTQDADLLASAGSDFHGPEAPYHFPGGYTALPGNVRPVWSLWE